MIMFISWSRNYLRRSAVQDLGLPVLVNLSMPYGPSRSEHSSSYAL
jgi:hypothetical protein